MKAAITLLAMGTLAVGMVTLATAVTSGPAEAKSCTELKKLCWTMRDDKSDCTRPFQRCLKSGKFITPRGRVFKATSRK